MDFLDTILDKEPPILSRDKDRLKIETLKTLRRLDGKQKEFVLRVLKEDKLIERKSPIISLSGADLRGINPRKSSSVPDNPGHTDSATSARINMFRKYLNSPGTFAGATVIYYGGIFAFGITPVGIGIALGTYAIYFTARKVTDRVKKNIDKNNVYKYDFSNINLNNVNLSSSDLSYANLSNTSFSEANLSKASFFNANLSKTNLRHTNLSRANLESADLSGADLTGAKVTEEQLEQAKTLKGAKMPDELEHPEFITSERLFLCPNCQNLNSREMRFCTQCGQALKYDFD
jgi:uncharacterized protein YjbI with pentapeptide repeats